MKPVLAAECVAKSFGDRRVLTSASLRAAPGELRVLLGRNGCGKSTLLRIAAGCVAPDSGSIQFAGHAYLTVRLRDLATRADCSTFPITIYYPRRSAFAISSR